MPDVRLEVTQPNRPEAVALIRELDDHLKALYPIESTHLLDIETLMQPNIRFILAFVGDEAVGCGAVRLHDDYAEVKRMYVRDSVRGSGVGYHLLSKVEAVARAEGFMTLRLETGVHQGAALKLYERAGFRRRPPFGEYTDDPLSLCYEKILE
jgi:putative acetyltransferase